MLQYLSKPLVLPHILITLLISLLIQKIVSPDQPYGQSLTFNDRNTFYVAMSGDGKTMITSFFNANTNQNNFKVRRVKTFSPYNVSEDEIIDPPNLSQHGFRNTFIHLNYQGSQIIYADAGPSQSVMYFKIPVGVGAFSSTPTTLIPFNQEILSSSYKNQMIFVQGASAARVYQVKNNTLVFLKDMLPQQQKPKTWTPVPLISCGTSGKDNLYAISTKDKLYLRQLSPIDSYSINFNQTGETGASIYQIDVSVDQLTILVGQTYGLYIFTRQSKDHRFKLTFASTVNNKLCDNVGQVKMLNNGEYVFLRCQNPPNILVGQRRLDKSYLIVKNQSFGATPWTLAVQDYGKNFIVGTDANFSITYLIDCEVVVSTLCNMKELVCNQPCSRCTVNEDNCLTCLPGYNLTPFRGSCCNESCAKCSKSASNCTICATNFFTNANGTCTKCSRRCLTCKGSSQICMSCPTGKTLQNNHCLSSQMLQILGF